MDEQEPPFWMIPAKSFARHVNPLKSPPWQGCTDCSRATIKDHIESGTMEARAWDYGDDQAQKDYDLDDGYHARRVAYLVENPCPIPIEIDVGIPADGIQATVSRFRR